jgi:hypothetical protein
VFFGVVDNFAPVGEKIAFIRRPRAIDTSLRAEQRFDEKLFSGFSEIFKKLAYFGYAADGNYVRDQAVGTDAGSSG